MQHAQGEAAPVHRPTKLFIGGISRQTTTKQLREHFAQSSAARILDCVAMRQPDGRPRGFGYVTLDSPEAGERFLSVPQVIDGRVVDIKPALPDEAPTGVSMPSAPMCVESLKLVTKKGAPQSQEDDHGAGSSTKPPSDAASDTATDEVSPQLAPMLPLDSDALPSVGSAFHATGECRRCNFYAKGRCQNGYDCSFCHFSHEKAKPSRQDNRDRRTNLQHAQGLGDNAHDNVFRKEQAFPVLAAQSSGVYGSNVPLLTSWMAPLVPHTSPLSFFAPGPPGPPGLPSPLHKASTLATSKPVVLPCPPSAQPESTVRCSAFPPPHFSQTRHGLLALAPSAVQMCVQTPVCALPPALLSTVPSSQAHIPFASAIQTLPLPSQATPTMPVQGRKESRTVETQTDASVRVCRCCRVESEAETAGEQSVSMSSGDTSKSAPHGAFLRGGRPVARPMAELYSNTIADGDGGPIWLREELLHRRGSIGAANSWSSTEVTEGSALQAMVLGR